MRRPGSTKKWIFYGKQVSILAAIGARYVRSMREPPMNFMDGAWHPLSVAKRSLDNGKCVLFERVDARYVGPDAGTGVGGGPLAKDR